jgi:hypothetical protein
MKKYIAAKPVRFDKNYKIGDEIPENVIDRRRLKSLVEMGKIAIIEAPDEEKQEISLEEFLVSAVEILGAFQSEAVDDGLEMPAEICQTVIAEINNAIEALNAAEKTDEDESDDDSEDKIDGDDEETEDEPDDTQEAQETPSDEQKEDEGTKDTDGNKTRKDLPDMTCPVCERVLGSKSAFTTHMKREHPDWKPEK